MPKGNEDARHFQGFFGVSAFHQWRCLRIPNRVMTGIDCGLPWWGADAVEKAAQARYHPQHTLSELQKPQHHILCRIIYVWVLPATLRAGQWLSIRLNSRC